MKEEVDSCATKNEVNVKKTDIEDKLAIKNN